MDKDVILSKLESLSRCIARIEAKNPHSLAALEQDLDLQDIIVLNLERAVQQCVDIGLHTLSFEENIMPGSMAETFNALESRELISKGVAERMVKAVGFRNTAVHAYQAIDWKIVDRIINCHLDDFRQFAKEIYEKL